MSKTQKWIIEWATFFEKSEFAMTWREIQSINWKKTLTNIFFFLGRSLSGDFVCHKIMATLVTKLAQKNNQLYVCEKCDYRCCKKSDFSKHLSTVKHNRNETVTICDKKLASNYQCVTCHKIYKSRNGLWYHKKKCSQSSQNKSENILENSFVPTTTAPSSFDQNIIIELLKQNQEFKDLIIEQNKTIVDLAAKAGHTTNNTNSHNKFNLNVFLNETCKDAINLTDFINNINISLLEFENVGNAGYVNGISEIIVKRLKDLEYTRRPLHCTDLKRETMYIREDNAWNKDTTDNPKLKTMVERVASKNCGKLTEWREENPDCKLLDHELYETCLKIMIQSAGQLGEKQIRMDEKIMKNVANEVFVDKNI